VDALPESIRGEHAQATNPKTTHPRRTDQTPAKPDGVILLYRLSARLGARIRGTAQLPSRSAPLLIGTSGRGADKVPPR